MRALALVVLLSSGCFAAVGPTFGIVVPEGRPTIGWEGSASAIGFGQSFGGPRKRRTYVALEPRFGRAVGSTQDNLVGSGVTLGWHVDAPSEPGAPGQEGFIGGLFVGGAHLMPSANSGNGPVPYFSIALGFRANEIYLAPKVGVFDPPDLSFNLSVH